MRNNPGMPVKGERLLPCHVGLSQEHIAIAEQLGDGNRSWGIRVALELAKNIDGGDNETP